MTTPLVRIAHRGGGTLAPENSIEGIETSLRYGLEMIEVDVRRSGDGALVLSHDPLLHGTALPIAGTTVGGLRAASPHVATLDEALDAARGRVRLNLDIKDSAVTDDVLRTLRDRGMVDQCIISCLESACLAHVAKAEPGVACFFSYPPDYGGASSKAWMKPAVDATVTLMRLTMPMRLRGMLRPVPGAGATIYSRLITPRLVALARSLGIPLYTWTVDDPAEMRRLVAMGVDGITSNRPDLLAELAAVRSPDAVAAER